MTHATDYLTFETPHRRDYVNITEQVAAFVAASGIQHGLCLVGSRSLRGFDGRRRKRVVLKAVGD